MSPSRVLPPIQYSDICTGTQMTSAAMAAVEMKRSRVAPIDPNSSPISAYRNALATPMATDCTAKGAPPSSPSKLPSARSVSRMTAPSPAASA